ncbi:hypothetical protein [Azonexus hydrophilus]|uniref:Uncharacterized protein n=1 Tax=Azonexus hydrophilus TaxID=418702 RepID=A0ABZ2XNJ2_9RHOO
MTPDAVVLNRIYSNEQNCDEFVSPEQSLKISLTRIERRGFAKAVFLCRPNIEVAARNLAKVISHLFPSVNEEGFLLDEALKAACEAYEEAAACAASDAESMTAFFKAMLEVVVEQLPQWRVHAVMPNGSTIACPPCISIFDWIKKRQAERVVYTKHGVRVSQEERQALRIMLTSALLSFADIVHLQQGQGKTT